MGSGGLGTEAWSRVVSGPQDTEQSRNRAAQKAGMISGAGSPGWQPQVARGTPWGQEVGACPGGSSWSQNNSIRPEAVQFACGGAGTWPRGVGPHFGGGLSRKFWEGPKETVGNMRSPGWASVSPVITAGGDT